jgi:hypothetical protein
MVKAIEARPDPATIDLGFTLLTLGEDTVLEVNDTRNWYDAFNRNHNGRAIEFARLFPVPGMNHCQSGPTTEQFDMLSALVDWVKNGRAPQAVVATACPGINPNVTVNWQTDGKPRSRPLCPYPQIATYRGSGYVNDAANCNCR